jgi:hypothetical protein
MHAFFLPHTTHSIRDNSTTMSSIKAALVDLAWQEAPNYAATAKSMDVIEARS